MLHIIEILIPAPASIFDIMCMLLFKFPKSNQLMSREIIPELMHKQLCWTLCLIAKNVASSSSIQLRPAELRQSQVSSYIQISPALKRTVTNLWSKILVSVSVAARRNRPCFG